MADAKQTKAKKGRAKKVASKIDPNTMEMIEGWTYPYSLMLPGAFTAFLTKQLGEGVIEKYGKVYAKIPNADVMKLFVENLSKSRDEKAKIIREGIMGV